MVRLFAAMPIVTLAYVLVIQPFFNFALPGVLDTQVIWPILFATTVLLFFSNRQKADFSLVRERPVVLVLAMLAYFGSSVVWAFHPDASLKRWTLAVMIVTCTLLPRTLKGSTRDVLDDIFLCFVAAIAINAVLVVATPPVVERDGTIFGHFGYFHHKQYLGAFASTAALISLYSFLTRRRFLGLTAFAAAFWIILESKSKSALGYVFLAPMLAGVVFLSRKYLRVPIVAAAAAIPVLFNLIDHLMGDLWSRIGFNLYGDATFTGRTFIWEFIEGQAALRPWVGWGFQSFWAVPWSPVLAAPGFIKDMPSAHSGYLDLRLETGYVGLVLFLAFAASVLHHLERMYARRPARCFAFLVFFAYIAFMNLTETIWFISFDTLWILFLVLTGAVVREPAAVPAAVPEPAAKPRRINRFHDHATPNAGRR